MMIKVVDLWKSYGRLQVLKGLNLDINEGETLVILGQSGVGKSVLLKQIIGLETPDKGYVDVNGVRIIEGQFEKQLKNPNIKRMGMLFQGSALFDSMNVEENVSFYLLQHEPGIVPNELSDRVDHALKLVGLENTQAKLPSELSGGMRKRAALARLIVYRPQIVLYDEPTTGLDPITAAQINELINKTKAELQSTSIVVTHDIRSAMEVGDRLAFHYDGKIAYIAPKNEFIKSDIPIIKEFFDKAMIDENYLKNGKQHIK